MTAALCELSSPACGVQAIGRCTSCGRPYCLTHAAEIATMGLGTRRSAATCSECQLADRERRRTLNHLWGFLNDPDITRALAHAMKATACPGLVSRAITVEMAVRYGFRGRNQRSLTKVRQLESAWPVGTMSWVLMGSGKDPTRSSRSESIGVTEGGRAVSMTTAEDRTSAPDSVVDTGDFLPKNFKRLACDGWDSGPRTGQITCGLAAIADRSGFDALNWLRGVDVVRPGPSFDWIETLSELESLVAMDPPSTL